MNTNSNMKKFNFPGQTNYYSGKVRDVYTLNNQWLLMLATNRISAFDVILPHPIPYKGQVLNQIAAYMLHACKDICPNWLTKVPAPMASLGFKCEPFKIEMVVRGHLTGHAWRTYNSGKRVLCGEILPEGLQENDYFPEPIITPSTKATEGHDEDIAAAEIIKTGLATAEEWEILKKYSLALFKRGKEIAAKRGLILVDTKYEFGKLGNEIILMDEIHTPDSSRYFFADGFDERQKQNLKQPQLSKEFVREWLIENNFMGKDGEQIPVMTEEWISQISNRYIQLYETLMGEKFIAIDISENELEIKLNEAIKSLE